MRNRELPPLGRITLPSIMSLQHAASYNDLPIQFAT